jgi:putative oxidoreductase
MLVILESPMKKILREFPFVSLPTAMHAFRLALAIVFIGHAGMRFFVPHYFVTIGSFLESRGMPLGIAVAWIVTLLELVGGLLLIFNRFAKWVALCFFWVSVGSIVFVQARHGWWVAEFGDGGVEFSLVVCAMCVFTAAFDRAHQAQKISA